MNNLDWKQYIANYPDLVSAGINNERLALIHYRLHGQSEGRNDKCINIYPVIVAIAKLESAYISEWVKYHLALGFKNIYLYDNEDHPTYDKLLNNERVIVNHLPGQVKQSEALTHFINNYMHNGIITHVAHIDIDEFIVLKKHNSISDFISEYIVGNCAAITMNWRFFGDSGLTINTGEPVTQRFTMCALNANNHFKTIFNVKYFDKFWNVHSIKTHKGKYIKSTNGAIILGNKFSYGKSKNKEIDISVIQLNHYKSKTFSEFKYTRTRGSADLHIINEDVEGNFNNFNINEIEDLSAHNFYKSLN
jgi:hypothetical protein